MPSTPHVEVNIDFEAITSLFEAASLEGRRSLFENEVYGLMRAVGAETPPRTLLLPRGGKLSNEDLSVMPGSKVVLKIVSPTLVHKTEVGGVKVVENTPAKIRSAWRRMLYEVPEKAASIFEHTPGFAPEAYKGLSGEALLGAISNDIKGVLMVQFMPPDSGAFGNELIVGIRNTREFGMVISAGLGGTDTELYAERFRKGQAIVAASTVMTDGEAFFELFRKTISYKKLAGLTRGQQRIVSDEQLVECFGAFIELANRYSPVNSDAPFVIDELEINPFAFTDFSMVPLDGLCKFSLPTELPVARPVHKIRSIVAPESIGIIGVSTTRRNFGRIILDNVVKCGFDKKNIVVFKPGAEEVDGVRCVPDFASLTAPLDLLVVAIAAPQVPDLVDEVLNSGKVNSVMLIPGGMGETKESEARAAELMKKINEGHRNGTGPVFLGANCMGVISHPGKYDTWFIPENKFPKVTDKPYQRAAFISQSGAFMLTRLAQCPELEPAYLISIGNQNDLTLGDMVMYFKDAEDVDVIAIYAEGFKDLDGLSFCRSVREAVLKGKEVVFYKAGRTPEGKDASAGHTASLAGDYMVAESCVRQAGAIVARNFNEFQNLLMLAERLHGKTVRGNRLAGISAAGFEAVGIADSIQSDDFDLQLATLSERTRNDLNELTSSNRLDGLVAVKNPFDVTTAANDDVHVAAARIFCDDPGVDAVVLGIVPMSPSLKTCLDDCEGDPDLTIADKLNEVVQATATPLICSIDAGTFYEKLFSKLHELNIPVFRTVDAAVSSLSQYVDGRINSDKIKRRYS
jgi:acyl-CoA synthetase (NDP forming)